MTRSRRSTASAAPTCTPTCAAAADPTPTTRCSAPTGGPTGPCRCLNGLCDGGALGDDGIGSTGCRWIRAMPGAGSSTPTARTSPRCRCGWSPIPDSSAWRPAPCAVGPVKDVIAEDLADQVAELPPRRGASSTATPPTERRGPRSAAPRRRRGRADPQPTARGRRSSGPWPAEGSRRSSPAAAASPSGGCGRSGGCCSARWRVPPTRSGRVPPPSPGSGMARGAAVDQCLRRRPGRVQTRHDQWAAVARATRDRPRWWPAVRHDSPVVGSVLVPSGGRTRPHATSSTWRALHQASEGSRVGAAQPSELLAGLDRDMADEEDPEAVNAGSTPTRRPCRS